MKSQQILLVVVELADQFLKGPSLSGHRFKCKRIDAEESRLIVYDMQSMRFELLEIYDKYWLTLSDDLAGNSMPGKHAECYPRSHP